MTIEELKKHVQEQLMAVMCSDIDCQPYISEALDRTMICISASNNIYLKNMSRRGGYKCLPFYCIYDVFILSF